MSRHNWLEVDEGEGQLCVGKHFTLPNGPASCSGSLRDIHTGHDGCVLAAAEVNLIPSPEASRCASSPASQRVSKGEVCTRLGSRSTREDCARGAMAGAQSHHLPNRSPSSGTSSHGTRTGAQVPMAQFDAPSVLCLTVLRRIPRNAPWRSLERWETKTRAEKVADMQRGKIFTAVLRCSRKEQSLL